MITADLHRRLVKEGVQILEPLRRNAAFWRQWKWLIIGIGIVGAAVVNHVDVEGTFTTWVTVGVVIFGLVLWGITDTHAQRLKTAFDTWREQVVQSLAADSRLHACGYVERAHFEASGLNELVFNRYSGSELLTVGSVTASQLAVEHEYKEKYFGTESHYNSATGTWESRQVERERTVIRPVFHGLFLMAPAPLPEKGWVTLRRRREGIPQGLALVNPAAPTIVRNYVCGASHPFVGHRTLTPHLLAKIDDLIQQLSELPNISYRFDQLYLAVPNLCLGLGRTPPLSTPVTQHFLGGVINDCIRSVKLLQTATQALQAK